MPNHKSKSLTIPSPQAPKCDNARCIKYIQHLNALSAHFLLFENIYPRETHLTPTHKNFHTKKRRTQLETNTEPPSKKVRTARRDPQPSLSFRTVCLKHTLRSESQAAPSGINETLLAIWDSFIFFFEEEEIRMCTARLTYCQHCSWLLDTSYALCHHALQHGFSVQTCPTRMKRRRDRGAGMCARCMDVLVECLGGMVEEGKDERDDDGDGDGGGGSEEGEEDGEGVCDCGGSGTAGEGDSEGDEIEDCASAGAKVREGAKGDVGLGVMQCEEGIGEEGVGEGTQGSVFDSDHQDQ